MKAVSITAIVAVASAAEAPQTSLALTWNDCGSKGGKITGVTPSSITLGTSTTISGTGNLQVPVSAGTFAATVKAGWIPLASCNGPLGPAKTCTLPLGAGSLTLNAISLPLTVGPLAVSMNVALAASLPAQLASTTTHVTAKDNSGSASLCMDIFLKQSEVSSALSAETMPAETMTGACSASDQSKINARGGGDGEHHFPKDSEECAREALSIFSGINPTTFQKCLTGRVPISSGCAHCYWEAAQYGFENCKWSCMSSWCSSGCLSCSKGGADKAIACAGFTSTSVPTPCDTDQAVV